MLTASIFSGIEFYVIATILAAAVVALSIRPSSGSPARVEMLSGILCATADTDSAMPPHPAVTLQCLDSGQVLLTRSGIEGLSDNGALSLVVTIKGFDIEIQERLTPGNGTATVDTALFTLDFLSPERYHIHYSAEPAGHMAAFSLNVRPGIEFTRPLSL